MYRSNSRRVVPVERNKEHTKLIVEMRVIPVCNTNEFQASGYRWIDIPYNV